MLEQLVEKFKDMCEYKFGELKILNPNLYKEYDSKFQVSETEKYFKIVTFHFPTNYPHVFAKIDKGTGNIYKDTCRKPSANMYKDNVWKIIGRKSVYAPQLAETCLKYC